MQSNSYKNPALRERLKNQIMASGSGGRPGQWSAIKAAQLGRAYKKAGGQYQGGQSKPQRSMKKWLGEKWRTRDGKPAMRSNSKGQAVTARFLPDRAWKKLSKGQAAATDAKKRRASLGGRQFVPNTGRAKQAGQSARRWTKAS